MNLLKKTISILPLLLCLQACIKDISVFDLVEEQNKIVINSLINNDQVLSATITKGFQYQEGKTVEEIVAEVELKEAQVAIYENDTYIEDMLYYKKDGMDVGEFQASFTPKIGANYRIDAQAKNLPDAQASASIPAGVEIQNASVKHSNENSYSFSFTLDDPAEKNYYYLKMYFKGYLLDSITQTRTDQGNFVVEISEGVLPEAQRYLRNGFIFKDDALESNSITIAGIAKSGEPRFSSTTSDEERQALLEHIQLDTSTLYIHLQTLSEDAYQFYTSNSTQLQTNIDFLNESASVYSNVENGLGLFAGIYISEVGVVVE